MFLIFTQQKKSSLRQEKIAPSPHPMYDMYHVNFIPPARQRNLREKEVRAFEISSVTVLKLHFTNLTLKTKFLCLYQIIKYA